VTPERKASTVVIAYTRGTHALLRNYQEISKNQDNIKVQWISKRNYEYFFPQEQGLRISNEYGTMVSISMVRIATYRSGLA
jgi:hypothetical protein